MKVYYWTEYLFVLAVHIRISATMLQKLLHNSTISTGASQMQDTQYLHAKDRSIRTHTSPENTIELLTHHHRPHTVACSADIRRQTAHLISFAARAPPVALFGNQE